MSARLNACMERAYVEGDAWTPAIGHSEARSGIVANRDGTDAAELTIQIEGVVNLQASDFVLG